MANITANIPERDRKQIEQAMEMLGPTPDDMGVVKNYFWGNIKSDLLFPYPKSDANEVARCNRLLEKLCDYLDNEHPHFDIDVNQHIPDTAIKRLFELGVMGMIIPKEYGGGGYGIESYVRVLQRIGRTCGSTAVMVSAHQSIGCGAIIYFGNEDQKRRYLPRLASDTLSAFCLSEPNVGSDAGGQETVATMSEDGKHYILNGEKKWATSAAMAGLFTVMAKQQITDPNTGEKKERISAFICEPDMKGIEVFSRNRSKCGIRGTWQGRLRFKDVIVPMENLLHDEGKGLNVALTCLDIGRCTLSAGMLGAAGFAMEQGVKWATTRYQFERPLSEFELIQNKIATMAAYTYAMDAMLYMTTGMLDRGDEDIMLETAICKVFSSEMGYRTVDHAMQIMGGEGYMTENVIERLWRDSRINTIVEGANEVMASFIFAYGSKQMGEFMLDIKEHPLKHLGDAVKMGVEVFAGILPDKPRMRRSHSQLAPFYDQLESHIQELAHQTKLMFKEHKESLITNQMIQSRLSTMVMWIHALMCSLSKLEKYMAPQSNGSDSSYDFAIVSHLFALGGAEIEAAKLALYDNCDHTMRYAAKEVMEKVGKMPNDQYIIPEKTRDKNALGSGKIVDKKDIPQFGNGFI